MELKIQAIFRYTDTDVLVFLNDGTSEPVPIDSVMVKDWIRCGGVIEDRQI